MLKTPDAAYLAGLFDGEGCLCVTLCGRKRRKDGRITVTVSVLMSIANTCSEVLDWCVRTVCAGRLACIRSTKRNPRNLPTYRYNLEGAQALMVLLPQLQPYLKVKWRQAEAVLTYLRSRAGKRPGAAFSEEEIDAIFSARLTNQKSYNKGNEEHILYRGQPYTRDAFRALLLTGRDGAIYHAVNWTPEMDALVGTRVDGEVARILGLKRAQVQRRRVALGRSSPYLAGPV